MSAMVQVTMSDKRWVKNDRDNRGHVAETNVQTSYPRHQQLYISQRIHDTALARLLTHILTLNFHFKIIENNS